MTTQHTSSIPLVLNALDDLFAEVLQTAGPDGDTVASRQGEFPSPPTQYVELGDVQPTPGQSWQQLGARERNEDYVVSVHLEVSDRRYPTQRAAMMRAYEILGLLETALRANITLGLIRADALRYLELEVQAVGSAGVPTEAGYSYAIAWNIHVQSRI